ncbi:MAG: hypothetical protein JNL42_18805 [Anaerolineae bacterium]|nr:hypothetical protein [Anaerolineae bacterium]
MLPATIEIPVPPDLLRAYETAPSEEQEKLRLWVVLYLQRLAQGKRLTLLSAMERLSNEAEKSGLTSEVLEEILRDDD